MDPTKPDFIPAAELSLLSHRPLKTLYNDHASNSGPFKDILVKVGRRLGVFRADYDLWLKRQLRLKYDPQRDAA